LRSFGGDDDFDVIVPGGEFASRREDQLRIVFQAERSHVKNELAVAETLLLAPAIVAWADPDLVLRRPVLDHRYTIRGDAPCAELGQEIAGDGEDAGRLAQQPPLKALVDQTDKMTGDRKLCAQYAMDGVRVDVLQPENEWNAAAPAKVLDPLLRVERIIGGDHDVGTKGLEFVDDEMRVADFLAAPADEIVFLKGFAERDPLDGETIRIAWLANEIALGRLKIGGMEMQDAVPEPRQLAARFDLKRVAGIIVHDNSHWMLSIVEQ
jgi:hypothetical protein